MRLPVDWIREYVDLHAGAEEIADRLTMAGLEVEERSESEAGEVLDIKVTPNRGDCLSVIGVARELAAAYGVPLLSPFLSQDSSTGQPDFPIAVRIEAPDLCTRYSAKVVRNVRVQPSPAWIQTRLTAAGMRPINNIVDITNLVMLETGQPLHAFDADRLRGGQIIVRRAWPEEKLQTLDGADRALSSDMCVIADQDRAVAVAGVMGGADTEMTDSTTTLLIESAHFAALGVRRSARALGMRTEASYRFERTVDPEGAAAAANRACQLIAELGAGQVVPGMIDVRPVQREPLVLTLRVSRVAKMLGYDATQVLCVEMLTRLGFEVQISSADLMQVSVPSWRTDILREIDLVEEVGRVAGYDRIPETLPHGSTTQGFDSAISERAVKLRASLSAIGLHEVVGHSLQAESRFDDPRDVSARIPIRSALSNDLSGLRRSLLPGLMETLASNVRRNRSPLGFFEVGRIFRSDENGNHETCSVAAIMTRSPAAHGWQKSARISAWDFYSAKAAVERCLESLGGGAVGFVQSQDPRFHPGRSAEVTLQGITIGVVGEIHPVLTSDIHLKDRIVGLELAIPDAGASAKQPFHTPPAFPAIVRDLAPRLHKEVVYAQVADAVNAVDAEILERFELTDLFTGSPLPEDEKSMTLSLTFRAPDRTLREDEVQAVLAQIRQALVDGVGAVFLS